MTLAVPVRGQGELTPLDALVYIFSPPPVGILGSLVSWARYATAGSGMSDGPAFFCGFVSNLALSSGVLGFTTTKVLANLPRYSLGIGFAAFSGGFSDESLSGGTLNPAVGFTSG